MSQGNPSGVRIIFLGGLGEIGRNMMTVEMDGRILVVDAGLSFPNEEMLGVDLVLPDFSYVSSNADRCDGVLLTHGHEDHVGALSWFLREVDVPVYGTPLTLGMAKRRLDSFDVDARFIEINAPGEASIGPFKCRLLAVSHSIPDAVSVVIDTPEGRILYTSDFKLADGDVAPASYVESFGELGRQGVDLMLSDSTNAERPGRTPSEAVVGVAMREIFSSSERRVIVACFASNLHRIQGVCTVAEATGRKVAFIGRSMVANVEVGRELGYLEVSDDTLIDVGELSNYRPEEVAVICTGSQGEPLSALTLIAAGEHRSISIEPGDMVVLSASPIPGNEAAVHRVINGLYRAGAEVCHSENSNVHVSGHAAADELAEMVTLVKPKHFVPVHGEYRHLAHHARIAERSGIARSDITVIEDGDVLVLEGGHVHSDGRVRAGTVLVDGLGVGDVGPVVLRDRKTLAGDGILICVVTIDSQDGAILAGPDLISRGFVYHGESQEFLQEAGDRVADALDELGDDQVREWSSIKKACRNSLGEIVWKRTRRRPMILPIVMEI